MEKILYKASEFCKIVGMSKRTLDRRVNEGEIKPIVKNRHRYFTPEMIEEYSGISLKPKIKRKVIAYARVSSNSQKKELENQIKYLEEFCIAKGIKCEVITDIGSGINFKRKRFLELIDLISEGKVKTLIITHEDRLARFAFPLIEHIFSKLFNTKIITINSKTTSPQEELVEDLMTIIHVFSARLYGLRRYKKVIKDACLSNKTS